MIDEEMNPPDIPERAFYPVLCLICEKELQIEDCSRPVTYHNGRISNQMTYDGVDCVAYGNYGSTVFDPMGRIPPNGFVICDECFKERQHLMLPIVEESDL